MKKVYIASSTELMKTKQNVQRITILSSSSSFYHKPPLTLHFAGFFCSNTSKKKSPPAFCNCREKKKCAADNYSPISVLPILLIRLSCKLLLFGPRLFLLLIWLSLLVHNYRAKNYGQFGTHSQLET